MGTHAWSPPGRRAGWVALLVFSLFAAACSGDDDNDPSPGADTLPIVRSEAGGDTAPDSTGEFSVRLSAGTGEIARAEPLALVSGTELTAPEIQAVFDRLPEWVPDEGDRTDFNRPPASLGPPRPGATISESFPPTADAEPGAILRFLDGALVSAGWRPALPARRHGRTETFFDVYLNGNGVCCVQVDGDAASGSRIAVLVKKPGRAG